MKCYGVILAGGGGTRFWPLSRKDFPKQFLNLTGNETLVNETIDRLAGSIPRENIFVVTNESQKKLTLELTGGRILNNHILAEPAARNTAACVGYAAMELVRKYEDGIMCVLPSDHYIEDEENYRAVMDQAMALAKEGKRLVTVGIHPTFPATGYGYIKYEGKQGENCHPVMEFVEKPDLRTARAYLQEGNYLWNSGMFIWKASTILEYFKELLPDIYECLLRIGEAMGTPEEEQVIRSVYPGIPKISIDYGIMERASEVLVVEGDFGWNDVGSWDCLQSFADTDGDENQQLGEGSKVLLDTKNCIVYAKDKLIATLGVEDLIIVEADDAIMVCHKDKAQEVKHIVEKVKEQGKDRYL